MARALSYQTEYQYTLKDERGEDFPAEDRTIWTLKTLNPKEEAFLDDVSRMEFNKGENNHFDLNMGKQNLHALYIGLKSVSNFPTEDGSDLVIERNSAQLGGIKYTEIKDKVLMQIPKEIRQELAQAIMKTDLTEDEAKN